jgi:hypothetical protein
MKSVFVWRYLVLFFRIISGIRRSLCSSPGDRRDLFFVRKGKGELFFHVIVQVSTSGLKGLCLLVAGLQDYPAFGHDPVHSVIPDNPWRSQPW